MKSKTNRIIKAFSAILVISMLLAIPFISPSAEVEAAESITLTFDGSTYTNPVAVGADPFVLTHDGKPQTPATWYITATILSIGSAEATACAPRT